MQNPVYGTNAAAGKHWAQLGMPSLLDLTFLQHDADPTLRRFIGAASGLGSDSGAGPTATTGGLGQSSGAKASSMATQGSPSSFYHTTGPLHAPPSDNIAHEQSAKGAATGGGFDSTYRSTEPVSWPFFLQRDAFYEVRLAQSSMCNESCLRAVQQAGAAPMSCSSCIHRAHQPSKHSTAASEQECAMLACTSLRRSLQQSWVDNVPVRKQLRYKLIVDVGLSTRWPLLAGARNWCGTLGCAVLGSTGINE